MTTVMKAERIHLRVDDQQKALLEAASTVSGDTVSAFVLSAATEAAANVLADRRTFTLDEQDWAAFDSALERPARDVPGLRELLAGPTVLDANSPQTDEGDT
ncbi:hypothetical protein GCM10007079_03590 [Nocardiopsis terrae]|uniref:Uncharacterized protein (DUF1778 family) n=1 Tax=Nocardiopsis terrae TaxID=372655 RepID=A0ABR9HNH2_9ACTN|nr:DUF1778 domain-containing protein [Nocardiopsis terrae]MBE1460410.1 uncharacterized protein (DUF1778 family) [Nocardiopsis terrae]GHC71326.1 hypothetical protein GCM10007079_03590 [Nocardiopsis terrae]